MKKMRRGTFRVCRNVMVHSLERLVYLGQKLKLKSKRRKKFLPINKTDFQNTGEDFFCVIWIINKFENVVCFVGSLTVENIGRLNEHSDTKQTLYPIGYRLVIKLSFLVNVFFVGISSSQNVKMALTVCACCCII